MSETIIVVLTEEALENYGEAWRGVPLRIIHTATGRGHGPGLHPGFDSLSGKRLYDLVRVDTKELFPGSLYEWEIKRKRVE